MKISAKSDEKKLMDWTQPKICEDNGDEIRLVKSICLLCEAGELPFLKVEKYNQDGSIDSREYSPESFEISASKEFVQSVSEKRPVADIKQFYLDEVKKGFSENGKYSYCRVELEHIKLFYDLLHNNCFIPPQKLETIIENGAILIGVENIITQNGTKGIVFKV